jgi:predicted PhzF superfamily epimerase YddE/YHI9
LPNLHVLRVFCDADGRHGNPLGVFLDGGAVPETERQALATELGFAETVFLDDSASGALRIFTPSEELPLAGHPLVGTAWLLRETGDPLPVLRPPAGEVQVRFAEDLTWIVARPEWGPPFGFLQVDSAAEVDALDGPPSGRGLVGVWAWIDQEGGVVRERVFVPELAIPEDEATGSAALLLCAQLGRELEIRQGAGSILYARPAGGGRAAVGGRVVLEEVRER